MEKFTTIVSIASGIMTLIGLLTLFITPIRDRVFKTRQKEREQKERENKINEGMKCLLRSTMLNIYYHNVDAQEIRQHEKENFMLLFRSYKELGGNNFIDDIEKEVRSWKVIT